MLQLLIQPVHRMPVALLTRRTSSCQQCANCAPLQLLLSMVTSTDVSIIVLQVGQLRDDTPCVGWRLWQAEHVGQQQPVCTGPGVPAKTHTHTQPALAPAPACVQACGMCQQWKQLLTHGTLHWAGCSSCMTTSSACYDAAFSPARLLCTGCIRAL
jgi:hypothetical protein